MIKKLVRYGNSKVLVIDKPILELLNLSETLEGKIQTDGESIIITPINKKANNNNTDKKFKKSLEEVLDKYSSTLKKLADN